MEFKGIDVSEHNGTINWDTVKASGIQFAIIRITYGRKAIDKQAIRNIEECIRVGMPFGVYVYSYALNTDMALQEANLVIKTLSPYKNKVSYPVIIDMEDADGYKAKNGNPNKTILTDICITECKAFENAGYYAMIYANLDWFRNRLDTARLTAFDKWLAQWSSRPTWDQPFGIWQYTSDGSVDGIPGRVDMNISYKDYPSIINNMNTSVPPEPAPILKDNTTIAKEVIQGLWGNGQERKDKLLQAGYNYTDIQNIVNIMLQNKKSNETIANEVIKGLWGNGQTRKNKLVAAGYDYKTIQAIVNQKLRR